MSESTISIAINSDGQIFVIDTQTIEDFEAKNRPKLTITLATNDGRTIYTAGELIIFLVTFANISDQIVKNVIVTLTVPIPGLFTNQPRGAIVSGGKLVLNVGSIDPLFEQQFAATYEIASDTAPNNYLVSTLVMSPCECSAQGSLAITILPNATSQLTIQKMIDNTVPARGNTVRYTINITNTGNIEAQNIIVNDSTNIIGEFVEIPIGFVLTSNGFQGQIPSIIPGQLVTLESAFLISQSAELGLQNNTVAATTDSGDQFSFVLPVDVVTGNTTLTVTKIPSTNMVVPGSTVAFYIIIKNTGTVRAENISFTDIINNNLPTTISAEFTTIPPGATITTRGFQGTIQSLDPDQEIRLSSLLTINDNAQLGQFTNTAIVQAPNATTVENTVSVDIVNSFIPTICVTKTSSVNGRTVKYRIKIKNNSNIKLQAITIIDNSTLVADFTNLPVGFIQNAERNGFVGQINLGHNQSFILETTQTAPIGGLTTNYSNTIRAEILGTVLGCATTNFIICGPPTNKK